MRNYRCGDELRNKGSIAIDRNLTNAAEPVARLAPSKERRRSHGKKLILQSQRARMRANLARAHRHVLLLVSIHLQTSGQSSYAGTGVSLGLGTSNAE